MIIHCNGKEHEVDTGATVAVLLTQLQINPKTVVVECNKIIVSPEEYDSFVLEDGAQLELIRFVGGG